MSDENRTNEIYDAATEEEQREAEGAQGTCGADA